MIVCSDCAAPDVRKSLPRQLHGRWAACIAGAAVWLAGNCAGQTAVSGGLTYGGRAPLAAGATSRRVCLRAGVIDTEPPAGRDGQSGAALEKAEAAARRADRTTAASEYYPVIVQCSGPLTPADAKSLAQSGGWVDAYLPEHAWVMLVAPGELARLAELAFVRWIGCYRPEYKLSPALRAAL